MKIILAVILFSSLSIADVDIAFIEIRTQDGEVLQLEPNGKFAHIAISYQNKWLHTHPYRGVELVSREVLEKTGTIVEVITAPGIELEESLIRNLLGKPYDSTFSWNNGDFYCSELVGKLLNLKPEPMSFAQPVWSQQQSKMAGELGLSPDDIYRILTSKGFKTRGPAPACSKLFMR